MTSDNIDGRRPTHAPRFTDAQREELQRKRGLSDHQIESLAARGLTFNTICMAELRGIADAKELTKKLGLPRSAHSSVRNAPPAICIPWFDPQTGRPAIVPRLTDGRIRKDRSVHVYRLRYDEKFTRGDGEARRYDQPGSIPFIIYVPRWQAARAALADVSKPLVVCEGEFKTLAAAQEGYAAIGIGGCNAAHDKVTKDRLGFWRLHRWITGGPFYGEQRLPIGPLEGRRVLLALDGDAREKPAVDLALGDIAGMFALAGVTDVRNATIPPVRELAERGEKPGLDDFLAWCGADALRAFLDSDHARVEPIIDPRAEQALSRREIALSVCSLHEDIEATFEALAEDPQIFVSGGRLVDLTPEGMEPIVRHTQVPERVERNAYFVGPLGHTHTPERLARAVVDRTRGWGPIRELRTLARDPLLRADGSVLAEGYDASLLAYVQPRANAPALGDLDDVPRALALFNEELLHDFKFLDPHRDSTASRAGFFAALFTVAARHLIDGPVPMFVFDAPDSGAGKSLLVKLVFRIALDESPADGHASKDDEELQKHLFAAALSGCRAIVLDNVENRTALGSPVLDRFLTSSVVAGRILGKSAVSEVPMRMVFFSTGNGVRFVGDIARRVVLTRIEKHEGAYKHENLEAWAQSRRSELYAATLTLLRAYLRAGSPAHGWKAWNGFDAWDALVRGALAFHGLGDPLEMRSIVEGRHDEHAPVDDLLEALRPLGSVSAKQILAAADGNEEIRAAIDGLFNERERARPLTPRSLTRRLARYEGMTVRGRRLRAFDLQGIRRYEVRDALTLVTTPSQVGSREGEPVASDLFDDFEDVFTGFEQVSGGADRAASGGRGGPGGAGAGRGSSNQPGPWGATGTDGVDF